MTTVYFVRHAQPDYSAHHEDTEQASLTPQGRIDAQKACALLADKKIDAIFSSPYPRAKDTVEPLSKALGLPVQFEEDFRERAIGVWLEDFDGYAQRQWSDFSYKISGGESLQEVQQRSTAALEKLLTAYPNKSLVIGGHGTCISTILNRYDASFGYQDFQRIVGWMPWIVQLTFDGLCCKEIKTLFKIEK